MNVRVAHRGSPSEGTEGAVIHTEHTSIRPVKWQRISRSSILTPEAGVRDDSVYFLSVRISTGIFIARSEEGNRRFVFQRS